MTQKKHKGTTLDSFLEEEALREETEAVAIKRVIAYHLELKAKKSHLSKTLKLLKEINDDDQKI